MQDASRGAWHWAQGFSRAKEDSKGADSWAPLKLNLEENEQNEETHIAGYPDLFATTVTKTVRYWHKDGQMFQWN